MCPLIGFLIIKRVEGLFRDHQVRIHGFFFFLGGGIPLFSKSFVVKCPGPLLTFSLHPNCMLGRGLDDILCTLLFNRKFWVFLLVWWYCSYTAGITITMVHNSEIKLTKGTYWYAFKNIQLERRGATPADIIPATY
jgi:hypothetical protein